MKRGDEVAEVIFDSAFRDRLAKLFAWRRRPALQAGPGPIPAHRGTPGPRRPRALGRQQPAVAFRKR